MKVGVFISDVAGARTSVDALEADARWAEDSGFTTGWVPHIPWSLDGLSAVALAGRVTDSIELGTAVMPTYPRHPMTMAQQALSAHAASGGRLALGIGPSHAVVIEGMYGLDYESPAAHTREYVEVLRAGLAGSGWLSHKGERFQVEAMLEVPGVTGETAPPPAPILVAALAPLMLRVAGEVADGTITYWADERAVGEHIGPRIRAAATAAGRPEPRVVVGLPVAVCDDADEARQSATRVFEGYRNISTYHRILQRGSTGDPVDVAAIGDEAAVTERLRSYAAAGATELAAAVFGLGADAATRARNRDRTRDLLAGLAPML